MKKIIVPFVKKLPLIVLKIISAAKPDEIMIDPKTKAVILKYKKEF